MDGYLLVEGYDYYHHGNHFRTRPFLLWMKE